MPSQKTIVVGAGPVGSLAALYAAARGHEVEVYELRGDLRDPSTIPLNFTKSINLALSERGINSLRNAKCSKLLDSILDETIPMHGRMIHGQSNGELTEESQEYDIRGRFIRAVDRGGLNKKLLDEIEAMPNVKLFFNHKLVGADFRKNLAWFEKQVPGSPSAPVVSGNRKPEIEVRFDFMIGADGAHSAVRYHLMKFTRMTYQQEYIETLWCEFHIPPRQNSPSGSDFRLSPNHLHIWPGGDFMFIAIPSLDKSFTSTLFLPESQFLQLDASPESLVPFFKQHFPGVVPDLISESELQAQYSQNPHLPLISIKCKPYHYSSSVVILGDAAHAMVPFYGQGMNAGLEDVRVLFDHLDSHAKTPAEPNPIDSSLHTPLAEPLPAAARALALQSYTRTRHPDAIAIADLAFANYSEMSAHVRSPAYLFRKALEERLNAYFPILGWATQYSRISFGNERYSDVEAAARRQTGVLRGLGALMGGSVGVAVAVWGWRAWMKRGR